MDNPIVGNQPAGQITFPATTSPCYVRGLKGDPKIELGEPDHSDSKPGAERRSVGGTGRRHLEAVDGARRRL